MYPSLPSGLQMLMVPNRCLILYPSSLLVPLGPIILHLFIYLYQLNHYIIDTNERKTRIPKTQQQDLRISLTSLQSLRPYMRSLFLRNFQDLDDHFISISFHGLFYNGSSSTLWNMSMSFENTMKALKSIPQTKTGTLDKTHLGLCPIATWNGEPWSKWRLKLPWVSILKSTKQRRWWRDGDFLSMDQQICCLMRSLAQLA